MLLLRKFVFYLFVLIYLVFCPILILYAIGYTYKPSSEKGIVKSGLIYLSTVPQGASVYLEGRRFIWRTPTVLADLIPGAYQVKLVKKKYTPWVNTLPVEAGQATVLERILLLPESWERKTLLEGKFEDLVPISGGRFFLLKRDSGKHTAGDFSVYDPREDKAFALLPDDSPYRDLEVSSYFVIEKSPNLLLALDSENGKKYLWVSLKPRESIVKDVTAHFAGELERVSWDPQDKKYVFAFRNGLLKRIDLAADVATSGFLSGILGYGFFDRKIYLLKNDFTLERTDLDGKSEKVLFQDAVLGASLFDENQFYRIKVFPEDIFSENIILFLSDDGELLANRLPYRFVEKGVLDVEFDPKLKRVLFWSEHALGLVDFSKERPGAEGVFEAAPKLIWVVRNRGRIQQAFWVYEGSHILFLDEERVFLVELETHGKPKLHEILSVKEDSSIFYSDESGTLFYIEKETGHAVSIQLLPKLEILPLPFPERKAEERKFRIEEV